MNLLSFFLIDFLSWISELKFFLSLLISFNLNFVWSLGAHVFTASKLFSLNEHDLESWRQTLDESVPSSPLPKRRRSLVGTHSEDVSENLITEVSEMKGQIKGYKKLAFRRKFSLLFLESMGETFSCCICKRMDPRTTLVGCQACSTFVGCQRCTDTCFGGPGDLPNPALNKERQEA